MKILITGANGYIGFPLALELLERTNHKIIGLDNDNRNKWVEKVGGEQNLSYKHLYI